MVQEYIELKQGDGISDKTPEVVKEVKTLQTILKDWGELDANDIDGQFGNKTDKAVKDFQEKKTLTPDGIVGQNTWAALLKINSPEVKIIPRSSSEKVPEQAIEIVTEFEGFVDHVYDDGVRVATIGIGTTHYPSGKPVRFGDPNITLATAQTYLAHDLETTVNHLASSIPYWSEMNDNQRSALISFAYNLGDHFYGNSDFNSITSALRGKRWNDVPTVLELYSNPKDPKVHQGLLRRRKAEGELWQGKGKFAT